MIAGIIKERDNNYIINMEEKDNIKKISVIHSRRNKARCLKEEEAIDLLKFILSSKLTFKEKNNGYDIYLDEADNKRYFKDGIEDFKMFFYNNGVDAIEYDIKENKDKGKKSKAKKFVIKTLNTIVSVMIVYELFKIKPGDIYPLFDHFIDKKMTVESIDEAIDNSTHLSEEEKEYLKNNKLFEDILDVSIDQYILDKKVEDIEIISFENKETLAGYYKLDELNHIYIREDVNLDSDSRYDIISHEFIHLLQDDNCYTYIHEACAELLSYEYYKDYETSYLDEIKRVKVLMEIIGPQPVFECNFKGDVRSFEDAVKKYLDVEDSTRLLSLFQSTYKDFNEKTNKEIDNLLSKMYFNKTGKDINDDELIQKIYLGLTGNRIYFNSDLIGYDTDINIGSYIKILEPVTPNDIKDSNKVEKYIWHRKVKYTEEEYKRIKDTPSVINSYVASHYVLKENVNKITESGTVKFEYNNKIYSLDEARKNNLIENEYEAIQKIEINNLDEIKPSDDDFVEVLFKDGTECMMNFDNYVWKNIRHYKVEQIIEPSIKKKFPKENYESSKIDDIEMLEMFGEDEKEESEVKLI